MEIHHLAIWTQDLEKMKVFYQNHFGCKVSNKYHNPKKQFTSYFLSFENGPTLELMHRPDIHDANNSERLGLTHFALNVGTKHHLDELTTHFEKQGITVLSQPRTTGDGYYESVILDPEHNHIELTSIDPYQISKANRDELLYILNLQKLCYLQEAEIYQDYSISPLTQTLEEIQQDNRTQTILKLTCKSVIVGTVRTEKKGDSCLIGRLAIDPIHQNKGLGQRLMEYVENTHPDVNRFELFTGSKSEKNLYLYQKLGYRVFKSENLNDFEVLFLEKVR